MTTLAITPNYDKKRLKFSGTVAAGEHIAVTVSGGADWIKPNQSSEAQTLRLRVIYGDKTVAVFPRPDETGDEWETAGSGNADAVCELNLNSIPAEKYLKCGGNCLWVLDDRENHTLYGMGEFEVGPWPKLRPFDVPYNLDGYPDFVKEMEAEWEAYKVEIDAELEAQDASISALESGKADLVNGKVPASQLPDIGGKFIKVAVLPSAADADTKAIYLVPRANPETGNLYDEYVVVETDGDTKAWDKIGSTDIDLSGYMPIMTDVTWAQLKALRDGSDLIPGAQYRITDYVATTVQLNTQSANHPFDIIVTADSESVLNDEARAIRHAGDTYFAAAGSDLKAWRVWYSLDNNDDKFLWADTTNGKGVIWRLIDEWNNDMPYDFKGITMKAYGDSDNVYRHTFDYEDQGENIDVSLYGFSAAVSQNRLGAMPMTIGNKSGFGINYVVFKGLGCFANTIERAAQCTFGDGCNKNTIGNDLQQVTAGSHFSNNHIGNGCHHCTFGDYFQYCTIGEDCYNLTFGDNCTGNRFGNLCYNNTFGDDCAYNTFGNVCVTCTFGDDCVNNLGGNLIGTITLGDNCEGNTFGELDTDIKLGSHVSFCQFGNSVQHVIFGSDANNLKSYMRQITIESNVNYVNLSPTAATTGLRQYQNVIVRTGVEGTNASNVKTIEDSAVNQSHLTEYQGISTVVKSV